MVFGVLNGVLVGILGLKCGQVMFERGGSRQSLLLPFEGGGHDHLERQQCWGRCSWCGSGKESIGGGYKVGQLGYADLD